MARQEMLSEPKAMLVIDCSTDGCLFLLSDVLHGLDVQSFLALNSTIAATTTIPKCICLVP